MRLPSSSFRNNIDFADGEGRARASAPRRASNLFTLRRATLAVAVVAAAVTSPAAHAAAELAFEGETMTRSTTDTTKIAVVSDANASDGKTLMFRANSWASKQYTLGFDSDVVVLRMRGNQCNGAPKAVVSIDGASVETVLVGATSYTDYKVVLSPAGNGKAGTHTLKVAYTNDTSTSTCNRNLYLDKSTLREAPPAAEVGRWLPKFGIPGVAVHAALLPTGKILYFYQSSSSPSSSRAYLLDVATKTTKRVDPPILPGQTVAVNVFCSGHSFLADGRVLVTGGTSARRRGIRTVFTFDPWTETWTRHPDMRKGRWYPSQVLLPDGRTVILDGLTEDGPGSSNPDIELFSAETGSTTLLSVRGESGQPPMGGLYPHLFVMPSGRTLVAGPNPADSWFFSVTGEPPVFAWEDAPDTSVVRSWGSGVLLPGGTGGSTRVALIGGTTVDALVETGSSTPLASGETFDEGGGGWEPFAPLNIARAHHNTVLLPDRAMATVGGGWGIRDGNKRTGDPATHRLVELYGSGSWKLGPSQTEIRAYHSVGMLLPDGRVLSAGDDRNGGSGQDTVEIYEPPYLFRGSRPTIASAPEHVPYGSTFRVGTPDPDVAEGVLVAPASVTHSVDMNQRYVPLAVSQQADGSGVELVAPPNANVAPPGYYMLFLLDADGVPSVAKFVRIH